MIPTIAELIAHELNKRERIMFAEVSLVPDRPELREVSYSVVDATGDEGEPEIRGPLIQPGRVRVEFVESVLQEKAQREGVAFIAI